MEKDTDSLRKLAYYYYSLYEGDTHLVDDAMILLHKLNFIDDNDEWINEEDCK